MTNLNREAVSLEEYRALRATIRTRGTARVWTFVAGLAAWAGLTLAAIEVRPSMPLTTLVPLLMLAGTFEAVHGLYASVERIGRYLQVFHEDEWEKAAMSFGAPLAGTSSDPLFSLIFALAIVLNFVPMRVGESFPIELTVIGTLHALFLIRVLGAHHAALRQREADLARFQSLKQKQT